MGGESSKCVHNDGSLWLEREEGKSLHRCGEHYRELGGLIQKVSTYVFEWWIKCIYSQLAQC